MYSTNKDSQAQLWWRESIVDLTCSIGKTQFKRSPDKTVSVHHNVSKGLTMLLLYMDHSSAAPLWAPALFCQARWPPYVYRASDHSEMESGVWSSDVCSDVLECLSFSKSLHYSFWIIPTVCAGVDIEVWIWFICWSSCCAWIDC